MTFSRKHFEFKLENSIEYTDGKTDTLYLFEPIDTPDYWSLSAVASKKFMEGSAALMQVVRSSQEMREMAQTENPTEEQLPEEEKENTEAHQKGVAVFFALGEDTAKFVDKFKKFLCNSKVCYLDSERKCQIKEGWLNMLSLQDKTNLMRRYTGKFLIPKLF